MSGATVDPLTGSFMNRREPHHPNGLRVVRMELPALRPSRDEAAQPLDNGLGQVIVVVERERLHLLHEGRSPGLGIGARKRPWSLP